jgi:hypothetical protein
MKNAANVARDRPCAASSENNSHPARFANDADPKSFWQATASDANPWLRIDLEGFYQLSSCRIIFNADGNYRFRIETSMDAANWILSIDRTQTSRTDAIRNDIFEPGTVARYVRMTLTSLPQGARANLCELELLGVLSSK